MVETQDYCKSLLCHQKLKFGILYVYTYIALIMHLFPCFEKSIWNKFGIPGTYTYMIHVCKCKIMQIYLWCKGEKNGNFLVLVIYSGMLEKKPHQDGYLVLGVGFGNLENI